MRLPLNSDAQAAVRETSKAQVWFFVCDSRRRAATVVGAHISLYLAKRDARRIGGCVRVGRVDGLYAVTF